MKQIPILFSTPMVQAVLENRKTKTRRIVKPQPPEEFIHVEPYEGCFEFYDTKYDDDDAGIYPFDGQGLKCPYGKPGDVLWVRESCQCVGGDYEGNDIEGGFWLYKADGEKAEKHLDVYDHLAERRWKPSIHMPKSACRIWLEVVSVKVERLQMITEQDAIAEGLRLRYDKEEDGLVRYDNRNAEAFEDLWSRINGSDSWEANPWVWVIEFKRIEKPEVDAKAR